jgi:CheY-like chemotaxis protein
MSPKPPSRPDAPGRRVLLIDDNEDNRESLRILLSLLGYRVTVAADGIDGVRQALRTRPEVAIIDIGLPGLDGCQVARRVRKALGREIVLVAYSAYDGADVETRVREAGFDGQVVKPADLQAFSPWLSASPSSDSRFPSSATDRAGWRK